MPNKSINTRADALLSCCVLPFSNFYAVSRRVNSAVMQKFNFLKILALCVLFFSSAAFAASPFTIRLQPYLSGLSSPLYLTSAKDGTKRTFVVEQGGVIKVVQPGANTATNFMDISSKVVAGGEQGLLGLAFHPQFATNGYFFVNYTRASDGATVIARFKTTNSTNALGNPNSEFVLLVIPQPYANHNGGMIEFGPDGNLYIGMGDGGSANDPENRAQNINSLLGKFLRITPSVADISINPYAIPADNPFVGVAGADEIYAVGVRNPFRFSFDRGGTRQLWAADVGQNAIEEVDIINKGGNYGWRVYEGSQCTNNDAALCTASNFVAPVFQYGHTVGRCSIIGGYVYRGTQGNLPNGAYVYGDYCTGEIFMWDGSQQTQLLDTTRNISSFGEDESGEIYVVGLSSGTVEKITRARANADFDGDFKTDFSVFRPTDRTWYIANSSNNSVRYFQFGLNGDIPTPEDYDGDNVTDISVFRPTTGVWYRLNSSNGTFFAVQFGANGDVPVAGDYDGDAKADITVFRPSNGVWYRLNLAGNNYSAVQFGQTGDKPTPGDFDGDGKYDIAVWRPSNGIWYRLNSSNGSFFGVQFGQNGDTPAQGDFDGDGKDDQAVYRQTNNTWYILRSLTNTVQYTQFGANGDVPVVGDYDGDGREDIAVFRPLQGAWYVLNSSSTTGGFQTFLFGTNGDLPLPAYDAP
ncbi:MAG: PQQ-dependent sugar dehydrogenase [Acidobacteriota bacterium]|nr:PQQ-dependent sugar dehydrogenase [Acidobacteriota bacterium]